MEREVLMKFITARGGAAQGPGGTAGPCGAPEQEKESRPRKRAVERQSRVQSSGGVS